MMATVMIVRFLAAAIVVWSDEITKPPESARERPPAQSNLATNEDPRDLPIAERMLRALKRSRPPVDVIAPASALTAGHDAHPGQLFPEGATTAGRTGQLRFETDRWSYFDWTDKPDEQPVRLLPNAILEQMVMAAESAPDAQIFEISGEFTVFEGENYLHVTLARRVRPPTISSAARNAPGEVVEDRAKIRTSSPSVPRSVEDVRTLLERQRPEREILGTEQQPKAQASTGARKYAWAPLPEGAVIVSRAGRIVRSGDWWTFMFDSDHEEHAEAPLKVLPSFGLEQMLKAESESVGTVFVVSGDVTAYGSENFLLPRVTLRRPDTGNFRK